LVYFSYFWPTLCR